MVQFQLLGSYRKYRKRLFEIPIELGGLPLIDPLMSVSASPMSNFIQNYSGDYSVMIQMLNDRALEPIKMKLDHVIKCVENLDPK